MTLEALAHLGEFVSGIGVVATLAYAFVEYQRHRRESEMSAAYDGEMAWSEFNFEHARDPRLALLVARSFGPEARLTDFTEEEQAQLNFTTRAYFHRVEAQWFVSNRRGLPPEIWHKRRAWAAAYIRTPIGRAAWEREKAALNFTSGFVAEIEGASAGAVLPL